MDFGTGGLDLAYEIMRGYDALVIIDASRRGGEPGTLYVIEPSMAEIAGSIEDGETINPHGMDPHTVLRFVNAFGASRPGGRHRLRARRGRRRGPRADGARRGGRGARAGHDPRDDRRVRTDAAYAG
jgi:hypothetical protein